jgi:ferredoxin
MDVRTSAGTVTEGRRPVVTARREAVVAQRRLAVDWPACKAHGVCAELLPEIVELDEWGYPVIAPGPVPVALRRYAQRAVSSCPTLALRLVPYVDPPAPPTPAPGPGQGSETLVRGQAAPGRRARRSS